MTLIRYLAATDGSPISLVALEYLKAFLKIRLPVRIGSVTGPPAGPWENYSQLLATPMDGPFVNVVCCDPSRWTWTQRVPMPTRKANGELVFDGEVAQGVQELRTQGVRNVLITNTDILTTGQAGSAMRYDCVIVPHETVAVWWMYRPPAVVYLPCPVSDEDRRALPLWLFGSLAP